MKGKLLLSTLLLAGWGLSANAQEPVTEQFECVADTWIRQSVGGEKRGTADAIELGYDGDNTRAGLIGFNFEIKEGMKVQSATVRLYSKLARTGQPVYVYGYSHDFTEGDACWNVEVDYHDAALLTDPIAQFTMGGHGGKSIYDSGINEQNQSLDKWTNYIDITSYVKSLPSTTMRINIMLKHNEMSRFYPKDWSNDPNETLFKETPNQTLYPKADLAPVLFVTFVEDANSSTEAILPVADTQIRNGNTANNSAAQAIEIKSNASGDRLYGLMRFQLPTEVLDTEKYELTGASLRLVCTQNKGDRGMNIFDYSNDFAENTTYATEEQFVDAALANDPIANFSMNGFGTFAMGDNKANGNWAKWTNVEEWTNTIDLTDYIAGKASEGAATFNILIAKEKEHNDAMKIATKEAVDITNAATEIDGIDAFTFKAEDLWPILTISYSKKEVAEPEPEEELAFEATEDNGTCNFDNEEGTISVISANETAVINVRVVKGTKELRYKVTETTAPNTRAYEDYDLAEDNGDGTHAIKIATATGEGKQGTLELQFIGENGEALKSATYNYTAVLDKTLGVNGVDADEAAAEYYTLQGVKVANPEHGIYIRVSDGKASKIVR